MARGEHQRNLGQKSKTTRQVLNNQILDLDSDRDCYDLDRHTASEGPHQAKQFHMRFIGRERGKVVAEREGRKRERD